MKSNEIITISGSRGFGKTTLAKSLINGLDRVVIWDIFGEYNHPHSYIPSLGSVDEFERWLKTSWVNGNVCVMVDEANMVMPERRPLCEHASKIINLGRHRNIGMIMITRRLASLNKDAVSQSAELFLFQHILGNDMKYLSDMIGKEEAMTLKNLKKFQYRQFSF